MAFETGLQLLTTVFTQTNVFSVAWVISALIIFFTLLLITTDFHKWQDLLFPVVIGYYLIGMNIFVGLIAISAILAAINPISAISGTIGKITVKSVAARQAQQTYKDQAMVRESMQKSRIKALQNMFDTNIKGMTIQQQKDYGDDLIRDVANRKYLKTVVPPYKPKQKQKKPKQPKKDKPIYNTSNNSLENYEELKKFVEYHNKTYRK